MADNSLVDQLDAEPEVWKPEEGDTLAGTIVSVAIRTGKYDPYPVIVVRTDGSTDMEPDVLVEVRCSATALKSKVSELRPKPGEQIALRYNGLRGDKGYKDFKVVIGRPKESEPEVDWSVFAPRVAPADEGWPFEEEPSF